MRLSALADTLQQRAEAALREQQRSAQALHGAAQSFAAQSQQLSQDVVRTVGNETRGVVERATGDGLRQGEERLKQAAAQVRQAELRLSEEVAQLLASRQSLLWKSGLALLLGSLLAVAGSGYFVWRSQQALRDAQFPEAVLAATRSGALTQCGDRLCARIGRKPQHFGAQGEYALVR
ncbi:hypothetical protein XthCFBP4691_00495 [Xanthomonas theicola]|uniref:Relaxation protein n=2 Tax=Xanthomonas theicola TaxID=56464 RepID=A0A2S6ZM71_9XANT|nr:hypothetical protein XthCFBP4691_00495 [Xanthomonas theicola]